MILSYDFRLDYSDGTFEVVRANGFASISDAKASLDLTEVEFVTTLGSIDRNPEMVFLAW